ncbi:MAG: hypothetical protein CMF50_00950 [Legionellales bacterium]|nr:hypothetical protein [Legionellales bacterium]
MKRFLFNSRIYIENLRKGGFNEDQAKAQATALEQAFSDAETELATKKDVDGLHNVLKSDMQNLRLELKTDMQDLRLELKTDMHELKDQLTVRMGAMFGSAVVSMSVMLGIFTYFFHN